MGDELYASPYPEALQVRLVAWQVDPTEEEAHVQLFLTDIDLDVVADQETALEMFAEEGWVIAD